MNKIVLLVIFFALIAVYALTQLEPSELKERLTTIHPITAVSIVIIIAYIIVRIKYKKKHTEDDEVTTKNESSVDSDKPLGE